MIRTITMAGAAGLTMPAVFSPAMAGFNRCFEAHRPGASTARRPSRTIRPSSDEVDRYVRCLRRQQNDAIDESNKIVDRFNCFAKGPSIC